MGATRGSNEELSGNTAKQTKRQTGTEALVGAMERSDVSNWQRVRLRARQGGGKQQFERRNKGAPAGGGQVEEGPTERGERRQERRFGGVGQVEGGPTERGEVACLAEVELCEGKYGVTLEGVTEEGTSPEAGTGVDPPLRPSCGNPLHSYQRPRVWPGATGLQGHGVCEKEMGRSGEHVSERPDGGPRARRSSRGVRQCVWRWLTCAHTEVEGLGCRLAGGSSRMTTREL